MRIRLEHVTHIYPGSDEAAPVQVLDDVSLEIPAGQFAILMGASGSGKSTLLNLIGAVDRPTRGRMFLGERETSAMSDRDLTMLRRTSIGYVFQFFNLIPTLNVFENIAFPLRRHTKMTEDEIRSRVEECLDQVHLPGVETKRVSELSGGQRRRVGFARAISLKPDILLFDELTTGLDPVISDVIADLIVEMDRTLNSTTVSITHDMKVAFKIADRVAMLHQGQIIEQGTPEEFQRSPNPMVQQFIEGRAEGPLTE